MGYLMNARTKKESTPVESDIHWLLATFLFTYLWLTSVALLEVRSPKPPETAMGGW